MLLAIPERLCEIRQSVRMDKMRAETLRYRDSRQTMKV